MKVIIIGGGAGGSSCAARLRRLDDSAEITVFEKTKETSIASCGLPYYIGNVIAERGKMQVAAPDLFKNLFNIDLKTECEVTAVNPEKRPLQRRTAANTLMTSWSFPAGRNRLSRRLTVWKSYPALLSNIYPMPIKSKISSKPEPLKPQLSSAAVSSASKSQKT